MAGSSFGNLFRITTFGESHGIAIGAVVDGCPAGLSLSEADIQPFMDRRKPGQSAVSTARQEADLIRILSGVFEGKTTGAPIALLLENTDQHSKDYSALQHVYRPGHADFTFDRKFGIRDHRGGGRSSGRETAARVAGGAIAIRLLSELGIKVRAFTSSIGGIGIRKDDPAEAAMNPLSMPDQKAAERALALIEQCKKEQDSVGGTIDCIVTGLPAGLGDPVFEKLDANLAKAILSIGAVKGFELGDGFSAASEGGFGSKLNDEFISENSVITKKTNHSGGTLGGISDGSELRFRAAIKPTPSIARKQHTVTDRGEETELTIHGRHDPVIVPRAVVVVECMTALVLADAVLTNMTAKMEYLKKIYE